MFEDTFAGDGALLAKMRLDVIHIRIELTVNVNAPALFNLTSQGTSRDKIFVSSRGKKIFIPWKQNFTSRDLHDSDRSDVKCKERKA